MKKFRFTTTIALLIITICLLTFGVVAILLNQQGVINDTIFISGNDNVFVRITANYDGPALRDEYSNNSTYTFTLDRDKRESYGSNPVNISPWYLGETNFTTEETTITLTFTFDNLNPVNDMYIDMSKIAQDPNQRFTTSYKTAVSVAELENAEPTLLTGTETEATLPQLTVEENSSITVQIIYELVNQNYEFEFANNIKVVLTTELEPEE